MLSTLAHELGHAVDLTYGGPARRASYLSVRGLPASSARWPCATCPDFASGAGDFAEVFAVWLVVSRDFRSRLAGRPGPAQLASLAHLFAA